MVIGRGTALLLVVVALGLGVLGLSFVPGWLVHERVLQGEGPRTLLSYPSAWQGQSVPFVAAGVVVVLAAAIVSLVAVATRTPLARAAVAWLLAVGLGVLAGSLWPVAQSGHASSVALSPGWPVVAGAGTTFLALLTAIIVWRPGAVLLIGLGVVVLLAGVGSALGRQVWLNLQEDSTQHYAQGTYTRTATGGQPTETLTLSGSTFRVAGRWSGSYEPNGLVIVFTGDPACPTARGSYHAQAAGGQNIRFDAIVDLCAGGDRQRDLETGIWVRKP